MNGRVPRLKTNERMIHELNSLVDAGWRDPIFMVDDNFIGNQAKVKAFLHEYHPQGQRIHLSRGDVKAFFKSLWIMGLLSRGRREYWKFFTKALLFHRRTFSEAMTLAIIGHHYRRVAAAL